MLKEKNLRINPLNNSALTTPDFFPFSERPVMKIKPESRARLSDSVFILTAKNKDTRSRIRLSRGLKPVKASKNSYWNLE